MKKKIIKNPTQKEKRKKRFEMYTTDVLKEKTAR